MSGQQESRHVLLTGSVPLGSAEEVFLTVADTLGERAKWVPDGETGERINWIGFQIPRLLALPEFELVPTTDRDYTEDLPTVRLKEGVKPEGLKIGNLGYADAAKDSFKVFDRLQKEGRIPRSWKFQVSLPTPLATVAGFVHPSHQNAVEPAYEKQILNELREIADSIPHDRLAIQWDVAVEFAVLEGVFPVQFDNIKHAINERLIRLGSAVPEDIDLGELDELLEDKGIARIRGSSEDGDEDEDDAALGDDDDDSTDLELADERGVSGEHVAMMRALQAALPETIGRELPVNVNGPIPAIMLDLGWPLTALKGIGLLCRTAGLVAHLTEEAERPIGFVMSGAAARAIEYDGK